jgi:hypothetical protein
MSRPDPIEYAERLYTAIRDANFSPISFLAFGNAVKEGVAMRNMPRIAVEPFMRVVGEMLNLEEEAAVVDAEITAATTAVNMDASPSLKTTEGSAQAIAAEVSPAPTVEAVAPSSPIDRRRVGSKSAR